MRNRLASMALAVAIALCFSTAVSGQSAGKAPVPDFSGVWNVSGGLYQYAAFNKDEPPMTPWGLAQYKLAKPSQGPNGVKLTETNDRVYKCAPPGVPYIYIQLFPMQIIQTPTQVIEFFEYDHVVRYIYTDGRKHPADLTPTYNGHSIGHWEGDTLVVDTIGFNGKNWLDRVGHPESTDMHIVERIRRTDAKTLQVDLTYDDPKSYTKPWTGQVRFQLHPDWDILEHICEDNLAFENFEH